MNRAERRKMEKEERRNSKKNFTNVGIKKVAVDQIHHDENLKECDPELLEFMGKSYGWIFANDAVQKIVSNGLSYLDSLCSLRFDITPSKDKKVIRDTIRFVSDTVNMFIGLYYEKNRDITLHELHEEALQCGQTKVALNIPQHEDIAPMYGDVLKLPTPRDVDDIYAGFVVKHANDLVQLLFYTSYGEVKGEETKVFDVLLLISKKTVELMGEASN